jgi:hypothetical protein
VKLGQCNCNLSVLLSFFLLFLVSSQRVLDVLYKHKSCLARPPATFEPAEDSIDNNLKQMQFFGRSAAATLTYDVQLVKLEFDLSAQHEVKVAPIDAANDDKTHEAEPSASESPVILLPVSTGGLASASELLKSPDDAAAACIQIMCDFEEGPAQVSHSSSQIVTHTWIFKFKLP